MNCPECGGRGIIGERMYKDKTTGNSWVLPKGFHIVDSCVCKCYYGTNCAYLQLSDGSIYYFVWGSSPKSWEFYQSNKIPSSKHIGGFKVIQR